MKLEARPLSEIIEELDRLQAIKDITEFYTGDHDRANIRYWAIRWAMGWEKCIPEGR